jgi:hypothetical protein
MVRSTYENLTHTKAMMANVIKELFEGMSLSFAKASTDCKSHISDSSLVAIQKTHGSSRRKSMT